MTETPMIFDDEDFAAPLEDDSGLSTNDRVDYVAARVNELTSKVDHLTAGVGAVYQAVNGLVQMLSAVQQVASMMPGGKRIAQAMAAQNGGMQHG